MMTMAAGLLALAAVTTEPMVVQAPDSPVRMDHAVVVSTDGNPPVLIYAATNLTDNELEQFTVLVYIYDATGTLKARQIAPGRRTLAARETKYSAMVLDGITIEPTFFVVAGVNQAQRAGTETWWRGDLQAAAEGAAAKRQKK
jgi:hypothetical protein